MKIENGKLKITWRFQFSIFNFQFFFSTLRRVFAGSEGRHRSVGSSLNFRYFCYSAPSSLCAVKHTRAGARRQSVVGWSIAISILHAHAAHRLGWCGRN